jgi:hypothetical protein
MISRSFFLKPFSSDYVPDGLTISGEVWRSHEILSVRYELLGPLSKLIIPLQSDEPIRRSRLWEETCFELFVALKNSAGYWEFNISPAGHWNVYSFTSYREGMIEDQAFMSLPFTREIRTDTIRASLEFDLSRIAPAGCALEAGISTVIKAADDSTSFWSLEHPGNYPDFHRRDCFAINL